MKRFFILVLVLAVFVFSTAALPRPSTPKTSGVYLSAADYKDGHLAFVGDCRSKGHRLELHDILNKPYIDVTHDSEKHRYSKNELFGFRACDGRDYRFGRKLEYQILEARELYIYGREITLSQGRTHSYAWEYYFSVGTDGRILPLTTENLKLALPDNHRFHDSLDSNLGAGQNVAAYDDFHRMFKVNRLLIASREL